MREQKEGRKKRKQKVDGGKRVDGGGSKVKQYRHASNVVFDAQEARK